MPHPPKATILFTLWVLTCITVVLLHLAGVGRFAEMPLLWVLSPIWIPAAGILVLYIIGRVLQAIARLLIWWSRRRNLNHYIKSED